MKAILFILLILFTSCTFYNHQVTSQQALEAERNGDHGRAVSLFVKLAKQGNSDAMVHLGNKFYRGYYGVEQDYKKAMEWWIRAYKSGNGDALGNIGTLYRDGKGVEQNRKIAYLLFSMVLKEELGTQNTQIRAYRNLKREVAELSQEEIHEALCYTRGYLSAYLEVKGELDNAPDEVLPASGNIRFKDNIWWFPKKEDRMDFTCKSPFDIFTDHLVEHDLAYYAKNTEEHIFKTDLGQEMPYRLFVPPGYDPEKQYPLLLYFHGAGGRGNDNLKNIHPYVADWMNFVAKTKSSFILIPQCPTDLQWVDTPWGKGSYSLTSVPVSVPMKMAYDILEKIIGEKAVDPGRIYVMGSSMGGYGAWDFIIRYPHIVAAAVPICGAGDPTMAEVIEDIPIWAFHGDNDIVVPPSGSQEMIAAIRKAGGSNAHLSLYKGVGHASFGQAMREPLLIEWIFKQRRMGDMPISRRSQVVVNDPRP